MLSNEEKQKAVLVHILSIFAGLIVPLIMFFITKDEESFAKEHIKEALNFQISLTIYVSVCAVLSFLIIPGIVAFGLWIYAVIMMIQASMAANKGEMFKYGLTIRMIK